MAEASGLSITAASASTSGASVSRGTCWSLTINNPVKADIDAIELPAGWQLQGQYEQGEQEGTKHFQGMLTTPQVRFSAVKKVFPRAHIELARNKTALQNYVHKNDTRVDIFETKSSDIPTLWDYQKIVAVKWDMDEFQESWNESNETDIDNAAMRYLDKLVERDILNGQRGIEFIAINPMWRSSWKKFWRVIVKREKNLQQKYNAQENEVHSAEGEEVCQAQGAQEETLAEDS